MKTIKVNLYKFEELSEKAKQVAIDNYLRVNRDYFWFDDGIESIKKALNHFNFELKGYSIGVYSHSHISIKSNHDNEIECLSGVRLYKYLLNNGYLKYYCKYNEKVKDLLSGSCPYTGYCMDEYFNNVIRKFISKPYNITFFELMKEAADEILQGIIKDIEYQDSEEFAISELIETDLDFTEDGELY